MLEPNSTADDFEVTKWGYHVLRQCKTQPGRQHLLQLGTSTLLPAVLSPLTAAYSTNADALLIEKTEWTLRLLMKMCAAGETACLDFQNQGVVSNVLSLLAKVHEAGNRK